MTELEMLTLAAKAVGITIVRSRLDDPLQRDMLVQNSARNPNQPTGPWNPREDDGDALRLAVDLYFHVNVFTPIDDETDHYPGFVEIWREGEDDPLITGYFKHPEERYATTRLAISLTAAQIGKDMP